MNEDWQDAIDDVIDHHLPRTRQDGEFSAYDYITRVQLKKGIELSQQSAERHLKRLVKGGVLGSEPDVIDFDGRRRRMYWRMSQDED